MRRMLQATRGRGASGAEQGTESSGGRADVTQGTGRGRRGRRRTRMRGRTIPGHRGWGLGFVAAVLLGLSWAGVGHGAPGDLDPTFGTGGMAVSFGPKDVVRAMVQQPDGKFAGAGTSFTVSVGYILLVRYLPDGRGDPAFGVGGKVTIPAGHSSSANALVLQTDGKLVVAGSATGETSSPDAPPKRDLLLARISPDGHLDATFGSGGLLTTTVESNSAAFAVIQQPDGKLVVAGTSDPAPANHHTPTAFLVRYHADGRVDASFGTQGTVTVGPGGLGPVDTNVAGALIRQPDGKLVVAPPGSPLRVVRVLSDGRLDTTFGSGGAVTIGSVDPPGAVSLVQQPDGKLVLASSKVLTRLHGDGRLDATFGIGGIASTGIPREASGTPVLVLQPDGKLVVAGYALLHVPITRPSLSDLLLIRVQPDGSLDTSFGTGGMVVTTVEQGGSAGSALFQQPDGKLVLASSRVAFPGVMAISNIFDILLARYEALGCPAVDPRPCIAQLEAFVADVYLAALARMPDASEMAHWVDVLTAEPTPDTVRGMLHAVFDGPEFRPRPVNPWQYVDALYQAMLGRAPASAELDGWVQAVVDRFNTPLPEFVESSEFQHLVPSCQDQAAVTLLVGRLYQQVLRRVASAEELAWWTQDIMTWCAVEDTVEVFFTSLEYLAVPRTLADHVTVLYRALLAREPDAAGLKWWVDGLAEQLAAIEDDVMASPEFEARVYRLFP